MGREYPRGVDTGGSIASLVGLLVLMLATPALAGELHSVKRVGNVLI
jgi:hypothetical protein